MKIYNLFRISFRSLGAGALVIFLLAAGTALAQEMPPPHSSPRVPVGRQALSDGDKAALHSRDVKGLATIIDGDHLQIGSVDLRLFGVVPPQLSASFGPQARAALDEVSRGQDVECHVRDRDHDGRFLATCATMNTKIDLALELLKRGLAVTARGSLQPTELAVPYETAEQAAETQRIGLWSVAPPSPVTLPAASAVKADNANVPPLPSELKKDEKQAAVIPKVLAPAAPPATAEASAVKSSALPPPVVISATTEDEGAGMPGFFARYQLLLTGLVILATALGIVLVLAVERRKDRRDEIRAIAAALRGELLAARAVCQARLKTWTDADEKGTAWPRIRATLYQAYVGRLGWLGAVLARQIASIYGQATDYAAYFNPASGFADPRESVSKRQALQTLVQHIEEVLPKLAQVEQTGSRPRDGSSARSSNIVPPPSSHHETAAEHVSYALPRTGVTGPIWDMLKKFTQTRRPDPRPAADEGMPDYTALIEEEMARMSVEEDVATPSSNVTKMRGAGG